MTTQPRTASAEEIARHHRYTFWGGVTGLVVFAVVAFLPTLFYASFAGVALASAVIGGPIGEGLLPRAILLATVVIAIVGVAALFTWLGSALGGLIEREMEGTEAVAAPAERLTGPLPEPATLAGRRAAWIGGAAGLVAYLLAGFLPTLDYGARGSVTVVAAVLGHPLGGGLVERLAVLAGTIVAVLGIGALTVSAGALLGRAVAALRVRETETEARPAAPVETVLAAVPAEEPRHRFTFWGGVLGLSAFVFFGLTPSLVYGGFAGAVLAAGILGHPVDATLVARGIVAFGMLIGLLATAALFVVGGAGLGAIAYSVAGAFERYRAHAHLKAAHQNVPGPRGH